MTQGHRFWKIQRPDCFANSFYPILFIYFHGQHSAQSQEKMELLLLCMLRDLQWVISRCLAFSTLVLHPAVQLGQPIYHWSVSFPAFKYDCCLFSLFPKSLNLFPVASVGFDRKWVEMCVLEPPGSLSSLFQPLFWWDDCKPIKMLSALLSTCPRFFSNSLKVY